MPSSRNGNRIIASSHGTSKRPLLATPQARESLAAGDRKVTPSFESWILAARPPTLWAAVAPVLVGTAMATRADAFRADAAIVTMVAALLIQVGVNFANDVADGTRGTDENRIGPTRAVASGLITPRQMWVGIAWAFGLAAVAGLYLIKLGGPWILAIGIASFIAALGYTNGPIPYGYYGLGEIFVFVFFGLVATAGTRYVFDRSIEAGTWVGGVSMGLLASAILVANNVRDIETDRASDKRTLAVIMGRNAAVALYAFCIVAALVVPPLGVIGDWLPAGALLILAALPLGLPMIRTLQRERSGPALIGVLKGTARLQVVAAVLLSIGILI